MLFGVFVTAPIDFTCPPLLSAVLGLVCLLFGLCWGLVRILLLACWQRGLHGGFPSAPPQPEALNPNRKPQTPSLNPKP